MKDGEPFAMAGLWERWDKGEEPLETFTIIVTDGNSLMKPIHDRMPVILRARHLGSLADLKGSRHSDSAADVLPGKQDAGLQGQHAGQHPEEQ